MKFRKGDKVTLFGTVKHDCDADEVAVAVDVDGHFSTIWPSLDQVELVSPKLIVGDAVSIYNSDGILSGKILAISPDGFLWVQDQLGNLMTWSADGVFRQEAEKVNEPSLAPTPVPPSPPAAETADDIVF